MTTARRLGLPTLTELLDRQDGVLARGQALAAGLSVDTWRWRRASGRWQSLLPGVAVAHSGGVSEEQLRWAAVLHCGAGAALTGDAALRLWGLPVPVPEVWRVAVPTGRGVVPQLQPVGLLKLQPHRVLPLASLVHPVRLPPVVRPAPAVLHAAGWAPSDRVAEARVAASVQRRLVTVTQLREAQRVLTRSARRALVRAVLDDVELGAHARSELGLLAFLRRHHLPLPDRLQLAVRAGTRLRYLDGWWEQQRVALEMDGAHHRLVGDWEADLLRSAELAVAARDDRVLLLRFTPGQLRHDGPHVADLLRRTLL